MARPEEFVATLTGLTERERQNFLDSMLGKEPYTIHKDALPREGVSYGRAKRYKLKDCRTYPGVAHDYWVYVPKCCDTEKPSHLMVFLDGLEYIQACKVHRVMENLILDGDMPQTIGLFVGPGDKGPGYPYNMGGTDNRSIEYDCCDKRLASFIIDEIVPLVEKSYPLIHSGNGISGLSSAGNAAFAAAWNRPDFFDKVSCNSGSFIRLRGGDEFPQKIRTEEKRDIKVSLTTGDNDVNINIGSWKTANMLMADALRDAGYDYIFSCGVGGHNYHYPASILPDIMRWLWKE